MSATTVIQGFSSTDKVPGFYGETLTGQGPSSAQSVPLVLLCVGIMNNATGVGAYNTAYLMTSNADADLQFGPGMQVSRQVYSALKVTGAIIWAMGIPPAGGAIKATSVINFAGAWSTVGTFTYRLAGETRSVTVSATDTPQTVATNVAADINTQFRWPATAAASQLGATTTWQVTLTHNTGGLGGNQQVLAIDASRVPTGCIASVLSSYIGSQLTWKALQAYGVGSWVIPITGGAVGYGFKATTGGTSGASEPVWVFTTPGTSTTTDASVVWTCEFQILTGGLVPFYGGTGTESVTNALAAIQPTQYDRIAPAQNDATNAAAWKTQVDSVAGPTTNLLEQVVFASNSTLATAQALAQTTLNDVRSSVLWQLNGETHPCEVAASFGAIRESTEGSIWAANYDDIPLPGVAIQSQSADWANHATQVAALNNGVTPIYNRNGAACIVRAIVSHSLNGATPDYSTLDVSDLTVPDQVRQDLRLYWTTFFKPQNPVVNDNPATSAGGQVGQFPVTGVATPKTWNAQVYAKLKGYEAGSGFPYPQLALGSVDQYPPVTGYDPVRKCLMSAVNVQPIAIDHQIGVSVRGMQGGPASLTS